MAFLKPRMPGDLTLDQQIEQIIKKTLGIENTQGNPDALAMKKAIKQELVALFTHRPSLAFCPKALTPFLLMFAEKHSPDNKNKPMGPYFGLYPRDPELRKIMIDEMKESIENLKENNLQLIKGPKFQKKFELTPEELQALEEITLELDPASPEKSREENAEALNTLINLNALLEHGTPKQLKDFITGSKLERADSQKFSPIPKKDALEALKLSPSQEEEVLKTKLTSADLANIALYNLHPTYGTHKIQPLSLTTTIASLGATIPILAMTDGITNTAITSRFDAPGGTHKDNIPGVENAPPEPAAAKITPFKTTPRNPITGQ